MELFGIRLRRAGKGSDRDLDSTSSENEDASDSDFEEGESDWNMAPGWPRFGAGRTPDSRRRKYNRASKSIRVRRVLYRAVRLLPKTSQGWGMLLLSVLVMMYLVDFYTLARNPPQSAQLMGDKDLIASAERMKGMRHMGVQNNADSSTASVPREQQPSTSSPSGIRSEPQNQHVQHEPAAGPPRLEQQHRSQKLAQGANPAVEPAAANPPIPPTVPLAESSFLPSTSSQSSPSVNPFSREDSGLWVPPNTGRLSMAEVKGYYTALALKYLEPFKGGISRSKFFDILGRKTYGLTPNGANKGIQSMLFQIKSGRVYLLDPYEVPKKAKAFYRSRINEIIYLLSNLAASGRIPDTEFLVSIHDCVQTASKPHTYRAARFAESNPGFTIVGCNFSDNIPIPMWEGDDSRGGGYVSWNQKMAEYAQDTIPWAEKKSQAVFRGGLRPSTLYVNKTDAELNCQTAGRSALVHHAESRGDILDVSVSGSCGGRKYVLSRLEPRDHHRYKYVLYAEGNCFWADRINRQLFGPSVIIKQETPCGQFFEPLLQPNVHYVPTDFFFSDLETRIDKLKENDTHAAEIVRQANQFAQNFLTTESIIAYVEVLLTEYTKLLEVKDIKVEDGTTDVTNFRF